MVLLNWIFPRHGGGWARRYLIFREDFFRRTMETKDRYPCPPVTMFDFSRKHDAADAAHVKAKDQDAWRISDDSVIGGFSQSSAVLLRSQHDFDRHITDEAQPVDKDSEAETLDPSFIPFIRWEGLIDTTVGLNSSVQRSGFAALRSPEFAFSGANLQGLYNSLELTCRPDGRMYTINLHVASSIPGDVYQGHIQSTPEANTPRQGVNSSSVSFDKFVLPFSSFRVTSRGRDRAIHRELDDNICIQSIGISLMDGQDGDFQFDLARIRAVNVQEDTGVFEGIPDEASHSKKMT